MIDELLHKKIKNAALGCDYLENRAPDTYIAAALVLVAEAIEFVGMEIVHQMKENRKI